MKQDKSCKRSNKVSKTDAASGQLNKSYPLAHLNPEQQEAVTHKNGPILVIAGAGTGKTRVITERIAYILNHGWCKNNQILGLTFTEKAAAEMEERLDMLMPIGYESITLKTFHAFCDKTLRDYGIDIGISPNFRILDGVSHFQFVREHLFEFELDYYRPLGNPNKFIQALTDHFGRLKEELVSPEEYLNFAGNVAVETRQGASQKNGSNILEAKKYLELANAYQKYQELLNNHNFLDFSDLQFKTIELLEKRPNILSHLQDLYQYVLVDEYQDTNIAQNRIVDMLCAKHRNLMAVGDDDQSIYKFRGAAISNILQFEKNYPDLKKVVLTKNYRSNQKILDFAYKSIQKNNPDRLEVKSKVDKKLIAGRPGESDSIHIIHSSAIEQEVEYVMDEIGKAEVPLSEIAILVRANSYAKPFIEALRKRDIPYQFLSERGLYDKDEIKALTAVLRILANPSDDISFYRVLRMPVWNIKMETIANLIADAKKYYSSVWAQIKKSDECKFLTATVSDLMEYSKTHTVGEVLYRFTESIKLYELLLQKSTIEAEEKITNIAAFFNKIREFERENPENTVIDFVAYLDLAADAGDNPSAKFELGGREGVQISSIHGVKGLEFNTVFVASLINRRFPSDNRKDAIEMPDELVHEILSTSDAHTQEERRLFYVACTRAKEKLHLLHSDFYSVSNSKNPRPNKRSRFIDEIIEGEDSHPRLEIIRIEKTADGIKRFIKPQIITSEGEDRYPRPQVTHITQFSYSQLTTFQTCPRQYQYQYIFKIPQPPAASLSFGSTMHSTLLEFYRNVDQSKQASLFTEFNEDISLEKLFAIYEDKWISYGYESKAHMETMKNRGRDILARFYEHFKKQIPNIEYLEKGFKLKVGDYTIGGRIDRADRLSDGSLEIIDYKTSKVRSQKEVDDDLQLMIYAIASKECFNQTVLKLTLYFLDDNEMVTAQPNEKQLEKAKSEITEIASQINQSGFAPTPSKIKCKYCPYRKICDSAM